MTAHTWVQGQQTLHAQCSTITQYSLFSLIVHFSNSPVSLIVYPDILNPLFAHACMNYDVSSSIHVQCTLHVVISEP